MRGKEGEVDQGTSSVRTSFWWSCGVEICDGQWAAGKGSVKGQGQVLGKAAGIAV